MVRELHEGTQCYVILSHLEVERGEVTSVIPVVQEFEDVFQEEVPASQLRGGIFYRLGTRNRPSIDGPVSHGSSRVGGTQETDRGADGEAVHPTQYFTVGSTSVVGEEKG